MDDPISVLVADDEETVRDVLSAVLAAEPGLDVVGTAGDAEEAIDLASVTEPDVALLDARMPGGGGVRATREIVRRSSKTRVIAVSAHEDPETVIAMLRAGAVSYVSKADSTAEIVRAIRRSREDATVAMPAMKDVTQTLERYREYRLRTESRSKRLIDRIEAALEPDAIAPVYQPIVDLATGRVRAVEALARFRVRPRRPPNEWFSEAESVGLLSELELATARAALEPTRRLPHGVAVCLNVSPVTLRTAELAELIEAADPRRVIVEVTEQAPVDDYDHLDLCLSALRAAGVRVAVDDVGAGFASLRHVHRLAPDLIKLDITLVRGLDVDEPRRALVTALVSFCGSIGSTIVAEGIETTGELTTLRELGVPWGQGFLLGRPGPIPWGEGGTEPVWPGRRTVTFAAEAAEAAETIG